MHIIGIEPKAPSLHIFGKLFIPRLGLPQLLTQASLRGHQCEIICEEITSISWPVVKQADLILVSSITSTIPRAYSLVKKIREVNTAAPILMGGPHVTFLPEEALDNGVDYVFRHEADESFMYFLDWLDSSRDPEDLKAISGISFKTDDGYFHAPPPPRVDLDSLPTPDLSLIKGFDHPPTIPLITSRGCPWSCEFCSEIAMFGRSYRFRSEEKILQDIEYYDRLYGRLSIFFADDNLGANRQRLEGLCRKIIKSHLVRALHGQVRLDLAKHPETLKLMSRAGFQRAYIGYESINPESLAAMHKGMGSSEMKGYTRAFHKYKILIHAMWVLGFDGDTVDTVRQTIRACMKWQIDTTQFLILVPIPGSELYDRFKRDDRIFNWDWSLYDGHHVNFHPLRMTARELQAAVMLDAMPKLYGLLQTIRISTRISIRVAMNLLKGRIRNFRRGVSSGLVTLLARLWGRRATREMIEPIRTYLDRIPTAPHLR